MLLLPTCRKAAFTLLELAMVLVVVGLLTGAVVAGRSFIKSAEITTLMTEATAYKTAFGQFQARFQAVPGDYYRAAANWDTTDGDGNGYIRAGTGNTNEMYLAAQHLALAGLVEGRYTLPSTTVVPGQHAPITAFEGVTYRFNHPNQLAGYISGDSYYFDGTYHHVLFIGAPIAAANTGMSPFLTAKQGFAADTKFDDGMPGQGIVVTPKSGSLADCATNNNASTANYATNASTLPTCFLILKVE